MRRVYPLKNVTQTHSYNLPTFYLRETKILAQRETLFKCPLLGSSGGRCGDQKSIGETRRSFGY
jgi:hypothetical protein